MNIQALSYINLSDILENYSGFAKSNWQEAVDVSWGAAEFTLITMGQFVTMLGELYDEDELSEDDYVIMCMDFDALINVYVNLEV